MKMCNDNLESAEIKFNNFLNKVIIFSSKKYYKKEVTKCCNELQIIDDNNYSDYLHRYIKYENSTLDFQDINQFIFECDNATLACALKKLSDIEKIVVFYIFVKHFTNSEISKILHLSNNSISRIKLRALKKIKNYFGKDD